MRFSSLLIAVAAGLCNAQSTFSPLRPPAIPLAVKSPYLNTILQAGSDGGNGGYLAGEWPVFWAGQVTGWAGFIRVDNASYTWLGASNQSNVFVKQTAFEYTPTKSIFTLDVGGLIKMTITFLSGVTPNDLLRSSLPNSYMDVQIVSQDGNPHSVQLYTDISAEWVSGDHGATAQWDYGVVNEQIPWPSSYGPPSGATWPASSPAISTYGTQTRYSTPTSVAHPDVEQLYVGERFRPTIFSHASQPSKPTSTPKINTSSGPWDGIAYHKVYRQQQLQFSETNQQADWGYWYYATDNIAGLSHQSGSDMTVRGQFLANGYLTNTADTNYRGIDNDSPVFGFAVDLGTLSTTTISTLFQISLHQEKCIQFERALNSTEQLPCLWTNYYSTDTDALAFFYNDYVEASSLATSFDDQLQADSIAAGGSDYYAITALASRQAFGALEFANTPTVPYLFLKEISSDGNIQTVDVIFPFHPIAIYTNPALLKYMLDPLFINQESGNWPFAYSIHDLGNMFPNATGHNDGNDESQPLEECGNMLIMTLAYAQRANDNAYLAQHYDILKQWNGYLIEEALIPADQISTDDFAGSLANQTNLALKGIIGIEAMAQIANRTGHFADAANYTAIAHSYITQWQTLGINYNATTPHTTLNYGNDSSYGLLYNLYGDAELGLGLVPQSVYDMQSTFYPTVFNTYGVPLDTRHTLSKNDWELFAASIASTSTKDKFIGVIADWLNVTTTNFAFTDLYDTITGDFATGSHFISRPAVGGMFSLLALNSAPNG